MVTLTATIGTTVDEVLALVDELDEINDAGLDLRTQALRGAGLAVAAGADDGLVVATLLHDIGRARYLARGAPGVPHEQVGQRFVEARFGGRAGWLVAQHETAGRYLAAVHDDHLASLPRLASTALRRHGGPLPDLEAVEFGAHRWSDDAVALRGWIDAVFRGQGTAADPEALSDVLARAWTA